MKYKLSLLFINLFLLSSCSFPPFWPPFNGYVYRRVNYFFEGTFVTKEDDEINAIFIVKEIDEEAYIDAEGKNVVKDLARNCFFSLSFCYIDENEEENYIDFLNFRDWSKNPQKPLAYIDDYNSLIRPIAPGNGPGNCDYDITIRNEILNKFIMVYLMK